jgi:hypothetical protein
MTDLSEAVELAVDTDPLKLRDALDKVLALCTGMETDFEGKPSHYGKAIAESFRQAVADGLKVEYP